MVRIIKGIALTALVLSVTPALATEPCALTWSIDEAGRVWMHHAMEANCGIAEFTHAVTFGDGALTVVEDALCPDGMATCLCFFATDVVVAGLAPGTYTVSWRWCEVDMSLPIPEEYCNDCAFTLTVPAAPPVVDPRLVGIQASGCNIETVSAVPEESDPGLATWGTIKALYR
jgi:hypothetical protein